MNALINGTFAVVYVKSVQSEIAGRARNMALIFFLFSIIQVDKLSQADGKREKRNEKNDDEKRVYVSQSWSVAGKREVHVAKSGWSATQTLRIQLTHEAHTQLNKSYKLLTIFYF